MTDSGSGIFLQLRPRRQSESQSSGSFQDGALTRLLIGGPSPSLRGPLCRLVECICDVVPGFPKGEGASHSTSYILRTNDKYQTPSLPPHSICQQHITEYDPQLRRGE